jgi:hypothetical protein
MSGTEVRVADVDFLVLTDSRLIRGFLEDGEVMIAQTPYEEPQVRVVGESYLAVRLSPAVCGLGEGDWWCWRLPDGVDPRSAAKKWGKRS